MHACVYNIRIKSANFVIHPAKVDLVKPAVPRFFPILYKCWELIGLDRLNWTLFLFCRTLQYFLHQNVRCNVLCNTPRIAAFRCNSAAFLELHRRDSQYLILQVPKASFDVCPDASSQRRLSRSPGKSCGSVCLRALGPCRRWEALWLGIRPLHVNRRLASDGMGYIVAARFDFY